MGRIDKGISLLLVVCLALTMPLSALAGPYGAMIEGAMDITPNATSLPKQRSNRA